jgi:hypothetical protein
MHEAFTAVSLNCDKVSHCCVSVTFVTSVKASDISGQCTWAEKVTTLVHMPFY